MHLSESSKLLEAVLQEPREEVALQAAAGLLDAVDLDGLLDACDARLALLVELGISLWEIADHLAVLEGALEVRSYKVDAAHAAPVASREGEESTRRRVAQRRGIDLVVVDSRLERGASDA